MSDIIERLRDMAEYRHMDRSQDEIDETMREAATEIERLRKALQPFALIVDIEENTRDGGSVIVNVNRCRDARAALTEAKG